ncbi:MAG TPA: hypothetical protein VHG91_06615 [Longimicrobium sp.]|nr:hypothetical protein [Longimicrobium sp.]
MSRHTRTPALALALLAAAALPACAGLGGPSPRASLLTDAPPAFDRVCRPVHAPEALPGPAELLEAAFAPAAVEAWTAAGRPAAGYVLLSMGYGRDGMNIRRAVIEHNVSDALADTLQKLVFAHRRAVAPAREEWGVRLRVDLAETPALRVGRREFCRPSPREAGYRAVSTAFDVRETSPWSVNEPLLSDGGLVWVRVSLDEAGLVTDARVERSPVRGPWEVRLLNYVRSIPFYPALEDGYPVAAETRIPVRVGSVF